MRIAIVSDIHGNRTALEAVLEDLRETSPDLVLHGGDLADGSDPAWVVDCIRDLGWPGVLGNTDEMLFRPESLTEFAMQSPQLDALWRAIAEMAASTREALGAARLQWVSEQPLLQVRGGLGLVHASPASLWRAPGPHAGDAELQAVYGASESQVVVYGHVHRPYVRDIGGKTVANSGSVGLPFDGDPRAKYLLIDELRPLIRRVEYDVDREIQELMDRRLPHSAWVARMLASASPQMP